MSEIRALKILEFQAIADRLASWCETQMGQEAAVSIAPLFEHEKVVLRLQETLEAFDLLGKAPPPGLSAIKDVRQACKLASKGSIVNGEELYRVAAAMRSGRILSEYLAGTDAEKLKSIGMGLATNLKLESELLHCLDPDGMIRDAASPELAAVRGQRKSAQARIVERIQAYTSGKYRDYLSDPIYTVRDGRYVVPLKADYRNKIKGIVHDTSGTGATLFIEPEDVLNASNEAKKLEAQEREIEKEILKALSAKVGNDSTFIIGTVTTLGVLDLIFAKARLGAEYRFGSLEFVSQPRIEVQIGRHPLLERDKAVPLDIAVGVGQNVVITGPNTGGKTVAIKTVGLFVAMLQCGMLVPAVHVRFGAFSQIWADIGDEQSMQQSLSTFSGHLRNIASALNNLKSGSLVLLDEVGAGTDPAEGAALARAFLLEFHKRGAAIMASTHYGELKAFAFSEEGFVNASMEFDTKTAKPTYRLILGAAGASQALRIAERYGIDRSIIEVAEAGLTEQQKDVAEMLQNLENAQKLARQAQSEADKRAAELRQLEQRADAKLKEAEDIRKRANERAHNEIETTLRNIRIQADDILENLKKQGVSPQQLNEARKKLESLDALGKQSAKQFAPKEKASANIADHVFKKGDVVNVIGMQQQGTLLEDVSGRDVLVQLGAMKMRIDVRKLMPTEVKPVARKTHTKISLNSGMNMRTEITLRNMRAEDAVQELERFIDAALLGNAPWVRIVHGKGEGILRQITQDFLKKHNDVKSVRDGNADEGGQGVTIAQFK